MKEFKGLLKSEIKKAEKAANKYSGYNDCTATGYSWTLEKPITFDPDAVFIVARCEICRNYETRCDFDVELIIPMSDRRRTTARIIEK